MINLNQFPFYNYCFDEERLENLYNNFNENSEKDQPVKVLFNTADHKVDVYKLPKQYINFNYDIYNQLKPVEQEKKILILILSCNKPEFIKLEDCIRKTWVKEFLPKYKNIQYYFYRSTNKKNIYIETPYATATKPILEFLKESRNLESTYLTNSYLAANNLAAYWASSLP